MTPGLVSIIVPCYNGEQFLHRTLASVSYQSYGNWECIIVDDGSTDASRAIAEHWSSKDDRFRCIHQSNQGLAAARNAGIAASTGEFIQFLDADDILLKERLEHCCAFIRTRPDARIVYSNYMLYRRDEGFYQVLPARMPQQDQLQALLFEFNRSFIIPIHAFLYRADLVRENLFDVSLHSFAEDNEYRLRFALRGIRYEYVDEVLVIYRLTEQQVTAQHEEKIFLNMIREAERYRSRPECAAYAERFIELDRYLRLRTAIAYITGRHFTAGLRMFLRLRGQLTVPEQGRFFLWLFLMLFISKESFTRLRSRISRTFGMKIGGFKAAPWDPPGYLQEIIG